MAEGLYNLAISSWMMDTCPMRFLLGLFALMMVGCVNAPTIDTPSPTAVPIPAPLPPPIPEPLPSPTIPALGEWSELWPGADVLTSEDGVFAFRHQPTSVRYHASFEADAEDNRMVSAWLSTDTEAKVAVNCGFYWENGGQLGHMGLLTAGGDLIANMRSRWGGVLIVRDGVAFVVRNPQRLLASATLGIQGWPMLIQDRSQIPKLNDTEVARRTAVGVDAQGRVMWVATKARLTLAQFAARLQEADLNLVDAVNLDGGISTGLRWWSKAGETQAGPDSFPIPCAVRFSQP